MRERLVPGSEIDGFRLGERVHAGAMGEIFHVTCIDPQRAGANIPLVMKLPRVGPDQPTEGLISFETESMILPALSGPHVPRFIAAGAIARTPYVVIEWIEGESLESIRRRAPLPAKEVARIGAALADALHSLHRQDAIHHDLKPENVILRANGEAALIDFGFAYHANYPDLLGEEKRYAAGSAPYISPEQVFGIRSDPRSDLFALGVVLYELATGRLPFGVPRTQAGLRDRLWLDPMPPSQRNADCPPWLQEVILRCLEPRADDRYPSAAHVSFDLRHSDQVPLTMRARKSRQAGFFAQVRRWWRARRKRIAPRRTPRRFITATPIIMVAVDTMHPSDPRQPVIQRTTARILSHSADFRLVCVSVIRGLPTVEGPTLAESASGMHLEHFTRLRHWVEPLRLPPQRLSLHVIESLSPADAILDFARRNHADLIVLGAPGPDERALAWWRSVASSVTASAPCSVHVVRIPERERGNDADSLGV